jgi:hypothetical protein
MILVTYFKKVCTKYTHIIYFPLLHENMKLKSSIVRNPIFLFLVYLTTLSFLAYIPYYKKVKVGL